MAFFSHTLTVLRSLALRIPTILSVSQQSVKTESDSLGEQSEERCLSSALTARENLDFQKQTSISGGTATLRQRPRGVALLPG